MNKLWRSCGEGFRGVKKVIQEKWRVRKSGGFALFLNKFCVEFCGGFAQVFSLLGGESRGFAHRTTITTIKLIKERK